MNNGTIMTSAATDYHTGFRERLRELTVDSGGIKEFAKKTDISYPAARKYLAGSEPSRAVLMKIIRNCGVSPNWLLEGALPKRRDEVAPRDLETVNHDAFFRLLLREALADDSKRSLLSDHDEALIRKYILNQVVIPLGKAIELADLLNLRILKASDEESNNIVDIPIFSPREHEDFSLKSYAFTGHSIVENRYIQSAKKSSHISFRKDYLLREFGRDLNHIVLFRIKDRGLEPLILDGSDVIVDCSRTELVGGGLFLFRLPSGCVVRRAVEGISVEGNKAWSLRRSDGTAETELDDEYIHSSGCVVGEVRKVYSDPR